MGWKDDPWAGYNPQAGEAERKADRGLKELATATRAIHERLNTQRELIDLLHARIVRLEKLIQQ